MGAVIEKPVQNLTIQDLEDVPIWEFSVRAATGPNDGVVRPRPDLRVSPPALGDLQPAIITPSGHVPFWFSLDAEPPSSFALTW